MTKTPRSVKYSIYNDEDVVLWLLLARTRHTLSRAREMELAPYEIHPSQALMLILIKTLGGKVKLGELKKHVYRESHSVSEQISRMEKQGLVRKIKESPRKARFKIELTAEGQKVYKYAIKQEVIHNIMSVLTKEQRNQLKICLNLLLEKTIKEYGLHTLSFDLNEANNLSKVNKRNKQIETL